MVKERAHKIYTMSTIKQNHTRKNTKNNFPSLNKILTNQQNQSKTLSLPLSASLPMLRCYSRINISILDSICHRFRMSVFFSFVCVCWGGMVVGGVSKPSFIFFLQKIHASLKDILWFDTVKKNVINWFPFNFTKKISIHHITPFSLKLIYHQNFSQTGLPSKKNSLLVVPKNALVENL